VADQLHTTSNTGMYPEGQSAIDFKGMTNGIRKGP
jgi:hypothetical protein